MKRSGSNSSGIVNLSLANYSQTDSARNVDAVLYFVMPKGLTETTCTPLLQSAKKLCEDFCLNAKWIEEEGVKKMKPRRNNIFILDPFSGPAYDFLESLSQKSKEIIIIGPQCVHYALHRQDIDSAIESRGFPFYTMGMRNICVTFTGFKPEDQKELTDLVQKMNGIVSKPFAVSITHVVANHVLTPKCKEAFRNEVPVMSGEWIQQVWKDSQKEVVDATDSRYVSYTCGIFHNINICVSQVASTMKNTLEKIIKAGGGVYSKDFRRNVTQVLIVPCASGEKYKFAEQWKVPAVTPDWVHKSKEAGHVVPFEEFAPPKRPIYNSTQISDDVEPQNFSNLTALSAIGEVGDASRIDVVDSTRLNNCTVLTSQSTDILTSDLDALRLIPDEILSSCKLYFHHCDSPRMAELRLILLERGIDSRTEYSDEVTHVVVVNENISEKEIRTFKRNASRLRIVSFEWLKQCALKGRHMDEESYELEIQQMAQSREARNKESLRLELNQSLGLLESNQRPSNGGPVNSASGRSSGDKMQRNKSQSAFVQPEVVQRAKSIAVSKEDSDTFKDVDPSTTVAEEAFVFSGFKFAVKLESEEECSRIIALITESSGEILQDKDLNTPDDFILVVPPVYQRRNIKPWQSFTKYWVNEVIEEKTLEIPEKFYHLPLEAKEDLKNLMNGVVLAISAYPTHIKEYITKLAVHLGARVQEVFSRKDTKGSLKSTHLICGVTDNDKYRAALRWGTPVVSCDWILECYKKKIYIDHVEFLLEPDQSDLTVSMYMRTPKTQAEKHQRPTEKASTSVRSNHNGASVIPGTDKAVSDGFRRPQTRIQAKLNFDPESDADAARPQDPRNNPLFRNPAPAETVESPIIHGMTREGSRQLKRAIDWALMDSPVNLKKERRKSTPLSEIMKGVDEMLAKRAEERRIELNISPVGFRRHRETEDDQKDAPEKSTSTIGAGVIGVNLYHEFEEIEKEEEAAGQSSKRAKMSKHSDGTDSSTASSSTAQSSKASAATKSGSSTRSTRSKVVQPDTKLDYVDDFVAGIHDDGEGSEIQWTAEAQAKQAKPVEVTEEKPPEVVDAPEEAARKESPPQLDMLDLVGNKNVKKKRGTGSSVHSHKSSVSSTGSTSGKYTRSRRNQEPEVTKTLCFATSGGTAAEKENYHSILTKLGGRLSSVEHYDSNADAVVAVKVARSEKILGSIAGGKPLLHPSYINACMEADRLLEIEDYIWKESHCKTNSEKTMTQVARYWYNRRKENPEAGPYAKFRARICEDKSGSKRNAYIRLIEAGGGRIVSEDEDPNIIICDERSTSNFTFPPNVPVKVPMFLNDVIINYDDKNVQIFN